MQRNSILVGLVAPALAANDARLPHPLVPVVDKIDVGSATHQPAPVVTGLLPRA